MMVKDKTNERVKVCACKISNGLVFFGRFEKAVCMY